MPTWWARKPVSNKEHSSGQEHQPPQNSSQTWRCAPSRWSKSKCRPATQVRSLLTSEKHWRKCQARRELNITGRWAVSCHSGPDRFLRLSSSLSGSRHSSRHSTNTTSPNLKTSRARVHSWVSPSLLVSWQVYSAPSCPSLRITWFRKWADRRIRVSPSGRWSTSRAGLGCSWVGWVRVCLWSVHSLGYNGTFRTLTKQCSV